jgi:hypothetical protein
VDRRHVQVRVWVLGCKTSLIIMWPLHSQSYCNISMKNGSNVIMLDVIGTDCIVSYKSNYHTITTMTDPMREWKRDPKIKQKWPYRRCPHWMVTIKRPPNEKVVFWYRWFLIYIIITLLPFFIEMLQYDWLWSGHMIIRDVLQAGYTIMW